MNQSRFIISYTVKNQPESIEADSDADSLDLEQACWLIKKQHPDYSRHDIENIQVTGLHHPRRPDIHPGHYQQADG